jgi:hypothetical protein
VCDEGSERAPQRPADESRWRTASGTELVRVNFSSWSPVEPPIVC